MSELFANYPKENYVILFYFKKEFARATTGAQALVRIPAGVSSAAHLCRKDSVYADLQPVNDLMVASVVLLWPP